MAQGSAPLSGKARFGPYTVDLRTAELRKHDLRIKLAGRQFALLALLLENPGEIVTRDEIRTRLWPEGTFVDFENNINSAIGKLRATFNDNANAPQYIETVGRGYRFIAAVELIPCPQAASTPALSALPLPAVDPHRRMSWWYAAAAIVLVVCISGWIANRYLRRSQPATPSGKVMIAVLPFQNLTGDGSQEYLSDGLTEEVITQLGNLNQPSLGVIARTSSMYYKNVRAPLDQVKRQLGVQYVMEGGVRRDGDHVRVTAQLIELEHQTGVWSRQYDRELTGLLTLQNDIALDIAHEVQRTFSAAPVPRRAEPQDYAAYDLYLKGQFFFNQRTVTGLTQAITYFEQSVAKDPKNARSWAGLAAAYALLPGYSGTPQTETIGRARSAAIEALKLDPNLPEAHAAMAVILQNYDWNWNAAGTEYRRAIALNPSYATAHHWYAEHLAFLGRFDEALKESDEARRLDPLSLIIAADRGFIYCFSRQYEPAIAQWRSVLDLDPNFPRAKMIFIAYVETHHDQEARDVIQNFFKAGHTPADMIWRNAYIAYVYGRTGDPATAHKAMAELESYKNDASLDPRLFALGYIGIGDNRHALDYLERAYTQHSTELNALKVDPEYDSLRAEPRFQKLLAEVGLAQ